MKQIILAALLLINVGAVAQSIVKGNINDENKTPVANATVTLTSKNNTKTASSDVKGNFLFSNVEHGVYQLKISASGFADYELTANVSSGPELDLDTITLTKISKLLQTVEILGVKSRKYNSDYSFSATKTAMPDKDIPQATATVTKELIADRQAAVLTDAVRTVSSVDPFSFYNLYSIRGFTDNEEGQLIDGMRTRQFFFINPLTCNVERVDVVKGNSSATFSSAEPGGSVNMITKKPLADDRKEVNISAGSYGTIRSTLDFTGPLNKDKTLLYRLNAGYQDGRSFRDLTNQKLALFSPSFSYVPDSRTSVNVEFIYTTVDGELDRGQPVFGPVNGVANLNSTPTTLNLSALNDYYKSGMAIVMANAVHHFTDSLGLNIAYMKQTWSENLLEHRNTNAFAVDMAGNAVNTIAPMEIWQRDQYWSVDNFSAYLNYNVSTGPIKHKLLLGNDQSSWDMLTGAMNTAGGYLLKDGTVTPSYVPANAANYQTVTVDGIVLPKPNVNYYDLAHPANYDEYISTNVFSQSVIPPELINTNALYLQEMAQWKNFTLLLALRNEWIHVVNNYNAQGANTADQSALLPRVGLTYTVNKNINLYATYLKGFQPQANISNLPVSPPPGTNYPPLRSELEEVGAKTNFLNGRLQVNAAVYQVTETNILIDVNSSTNQDSVAVRGGARSRGAELDITGYIMPNWQFVASCAYTDARILKDSDPALANAREENAPVNMANLWTRYNFTDQSALRGIGVGFGVQYRDKSIAWLDRSLILPAYTVMDAAIYLTPYKSNLQFAFNVYNIANTTYWTGAFNYLRLFPGAPRNEMLTATYKF